MRILDRSVYVGPSAYARFPVIRLGTGPRRARGLADRPARRRLVNALAEALPGLAEHGCSYREPGGFLRRMREDEGTWLGHVLEHVAIELQNVAGEEVTFGKTRSAGSPASTRSSMSTRSATKASRPASSRCGCCARCCPGAATAGSVPEGWNWPEARDDFIRFAQRRALGPSTASLVRAAEVARHPVAATQ
jgi:cyanophycin synthetase